MELYMIKAVGHGRLPRDMHTILQALDGVECQAQPIDESTLNRCLENKIEENERETLVRNFRNSEESGKEKLLFLIFELRKNFTMPTIVQLLADMDQTPISTSLKFYWYGYSNSISRGCTRDLKKIKTFWCLIKKLTDDGYIRNPRTYFRSLADRYKAKIKEAGDKQMAVDKYAIITWFQIQQYEKDDCQERRGILETMKSLNTADADDRLIDIVYHSKMTTTLEFEDKIEDACDMGKRAKYLSAIFNDKSAEVLAHYSYFFFHRKVFLKDKTSMNRQRAIEQCTHGCSMFVDAEDDFERFCYLLFLLYMAGEYLQITYDFEVLDTFPVEVEDIRSAEEVLKTASQFLDTSDPRRELAYTYGMCRLYQVKEEIPKSLEFIEKAKALMEDGTLNSIEKRHINTFFYKVKNQHKCLPPR